ncbi:MAG: restriction endonuclease subunit S [Bacteroidaceae bacterium]|nr:restriction endonuclease subunit S [Bacteroidaceae bacterium]
MKQGWEIKKLGEVCEVICGQDYKAVKDDNGKYPIYGTGGVMGYASQYRCPSNSVIIGRKGSINNPLFVETEFWNVDTAFGVVPNKEVLCPKFFFLFCKSFDFTRLDVSVTIPSLRRVDILQIPIPVPPLPVQEQIVSKLDLLSSITEKKREQLKELDALAQSIFYDMFGDPITNEKGWEVKKLGEVAPAKEYKGEIPNKDGKYWLLNLDMVTAHTGEIIEQCYFEPNEIGNSTIVFNGENVLYSKLRPYLNKVVLPKDIGFATSELVPLFPNKLQLDRMYLAHTLRSSSFVEYISAKVAGAKMPRVSMNEFRTFPIPLPPLPLQHQFASKIEAIERQKELIKQSISETETLFNARMQEHFG